MEIETCSVLCALLCGFIEPVSSRSGDSRVECAFVLGCLWNKSSNRVNSGQPQLLLLCSCVCAGAHLETINGNISHFRAPSFLMSGCLSAKQICLIMKNVTSTRTTSVPGPSLEVVLVVVHVIKLIRYQLAVESSGKGNRERAES